jgi:hypothetical protein
MDATEKKELEALFRQHIGVKWRRILRLVYKQWTIPNLEERFHVSTSHPLQLRV